MLIKQKDDLKPLLDTLEALLTLPTLTNKQRERIEEEIDKVRVGVKGEKDAAYHIDFKLKDSKNWVVVHDLRLEHNGRVAQIDHLLDSEATQCGAGIPAPRSPEQRPAALLKQGPARTTMGTVLFGS